MIAACAASGLGSGRVEVQIAFGADQLREQRRQLPAHRRQILVGAVRHAAGQTAPGGVRVGQLQDGPLDQADPVVLVDGADFPADVAAGLVGRADHPLGEHGGEGAFEVAAFAFQRVDFLQLVQKFRRGFRRQSGREIIRFRREFSAVTLHAEPLFGCLQQLLNPVQYLFAALRVDPEKFRLLLRRFAPFRRQFFEIVVLEVPAGVDGAGRLLADHPVARVFQLFLCRHRQQHRGDRPDHHQHHHGGGAGTVEGVAELFQIEPRLGVDHPFAPQFAAGAVTGQKLFQRGKHGGYCSFSGWDAGLS